MTNMLWSFNIKMQGVFCYDGSKIITIFFQKALIASLSDTHIPYEKMIQQATAL